MDAIKNRKLSMDLAKRVAFLAERREAAIEEEPVLDVLQEDAQIVVYDGESRVRYRSPVVGIERTYLCSVRHVTMRGAAALAHDFLFEHCVDSLRLVGLDGRALSGGEDDAVAEFEKIIEDNITPARITAKKIYLKKGFITPCLLADVWIRSGRPTKVVLDGVVLCGAEGEVLLCLRRLLEEISCFAARDVQIGRRALEIREFHDIAERMQHRLYKNGDVLYEFRRTLVDVPSYVRLQNCAQEEYRRVFPDVEGLFIVDERLTVGKIKSLSSTRLRVLEVDACHKFDPDVLVTIASRWTGGLVLLSLRNMCFLVRSAETLYYFLSQNSETLRFVDVRGSNLPESIVLMLERRLKDCRLIYASGKMVLI